METLNQRINSRREFLIHSFKTALFIGAATNLGLMSCKKEDTTSPATSTATTTTNPPVMEEVRILHIRHATNIIKVKGVTILVDPFLNHVDGSTMPFKDNELVELLGTVDIILLSHPHSDHIDFGVVPFVKDKPIFCQPTDVSFLSKGGFKNVKPVSTSEKWKEITITRVGALHGAHTGAIASGYVLQAANCKTIYITGDTIWYDGMESTLKTFSPEICIVNAGAAGPVDDPMTMNAKQVEILCNKSLNTKIVAVHMGFPTADFWKETKTDLKNYLDSKNLLSRVLIPLEGDEIKLS